MSEITSFTEVNPFEEGFGEGLPSIGWGEEYTPYDGDEDPKNPIEELGLPPEGEVYIKEPRLPRDDGAITPSMLITMEHLNVQDFTADEPMGPYLGNENMTADAENSMPADVASNDVPSV
ncbi:MAG TPA: hypothetical protein VHT70_02770 [Candidatus Saccharimonadales bacterium]|jgi:hypothetical protein|nr:hypothetical protein [Candidatus Saccharimonadales bacterium]